MLDSERTFRIKVRSSKVRNLAYVSSYFHLKSFYGKEIVQYLQNHKRRKVNQGHSKKLL